MRWKRDLRELSKPLILISGPTGVGKSDIAVELAKVIGGEIISADSVQVYRGLDIGSAKISYSEMDGIPHHLIDVLNPDDDFDVSIFVKLATEAINTIYSHNHIPIIVGGTAFYIQALLYGIDFSEEEDQDKTYREELDKWVNDNEDGARLLWERLNSIDPDYAATVHYNNTRRVIRALEYNHHTGRLFSEYNKEQSERSSQYNFVYVGLTDDREVLYRKINARVDKMIDEGLIDEVKHLIESGYDSRYNSMNSIGYKEICSYLDGTISLEEAIDKIKLNSRHYAKRQLTWLRREKDIHFIDRSDYDTSAKVVEAILQLREYQD